MFINENYYGLSEVNRERYKDVGKKLYLCDEYNMKCYTPNPLSCIKEVPVKLVNALIHRLNDKPDINGLSPTLPRIVLIAPDWDMVKYIGHYKFGISKISEKLLQWTISQMVQEVETRKNDLSRIKKGAVVHNEPKVIWIKMLDRPGCINKALSVCGKFNRAMEGRPGQLYKSLHHGSIQTNE